MSLAVGKSICPHDCPDTCGMLAFVEDGKLVKVAGDPEHPITRGRLCSKANHYTERVYGPDRVLRPLRRIGPKGEGRFTEITWDEALDTIASRFRTILDEHGGDAILPYSYGGTLGVVNQASMDRRFFYSLGACLLDRSICSAAGKAGYAYSIGAMMGSDPEATPHAKLIVVWGCNSVSTNVHDMLFIREAQRRGALFVVIDVHRNRTAKLADWFVQLYPGTDGALALGLMNVIINEDLYDAEYVSRHTVGFDALRERVQEYPPELVSKITGVSVEDIRRLARLYVERKPSLIRIGNGLQHHSNGGMNTRNIALLPALVGGWGQLGGGAFKSNGDYFAFNRAAIERPDLLKRKPRMVNMNQLGWALTEAQPSIQALYVYNCNPAVVVPEQRKVLEGLRREDLFTVVHDSLLTDSAMYADIVLPATTHFEHLDLYKSYYHLYLALAEPVIPPVGESKPNVEVFSLLAQRMGFKEPCFRDTAEDIIRQALDNESPYLAGISLERLKREKLVHLNTPTIPHIAFPDGRFPTPSGKVEFYSARMAADGYDPLPSYTPPAEGADGPPEVLAKYPLMFVTPPAHNFLNSTYGNMPTTLALERQPTVEIHPQDAEVRGIREGDLVRVWNDRGECRLHAKVIESVLPGVAVALGVWWLRGSLGNANVNQTTPSRLADMGGGATLFSNLVEIESVSS